jgi:hypothetical protein
MNSRRPSLDNLVRRLLCPHRKRPSGNRAGKNTDDILPLCSDKIIV